MKFHNKLDTPRDCTLYNVSGTDSFRLGSRQMLQSKANYDNRNYGGNRQNINKSMRPIWKADSGYLLIQRDQSGAEALIVAHLCRDAKYRSLFKNGIKPHTYLALKLFQDVWKVEYNKEKVEQAVACSIPELRELPFWKELSSIISGSDNWANNRRYYHFAKKTIHAGSYGMKERTFVQAMLKESAGQINLKLEEGQKFLMGFHTEFPEIHNWHSRTFETIKKNKQLRNLFGFPYNITNYIDENDFKDLIAWVPQSTVACITRQCFVRMYEYIETNNKNWHLLHDTHDSLCFEVPENEVEEALRISKEFMEIELTSPYDGTTFRMRSEAGVGKNWGPKKDSNKDGLETVKE